MDNSNGQSVVALPNNQPADFSALVAALAEALKPGIAAASASAPAAAWLHEGTAARKAGKAKHRRAGESMPVVTRQAERSTYEGHAGWKVTKYHDGRPGRWKFISDDNLAAIDAKRGRK